MTDEVEMQSVLSNSKSKILVGNRGSEFVPVNLLNYMRVELSCTISNFSQQKLKRKSVI